MAKNCQHNPLSELKDNIDLAFVNFIKDSNLDSIIPTQLLPKFFEAVEEATVTKLVKFRTRPKETIKVTEKAKSNSTISQDDAKMKAQKAAKMKAQEAAERKVEDLKRSIDLASKNETKMFLDSSILDNYLETSDSKNYTLKKDLELDELDLEFREGEILTINPGITLKNKRRISLLAKGSQIKNKGKIENSGNIFIRKSENSGNINIRKSENSGNINIGKSEKGTLSTGTDSTEPSWPKAEDFFDINPNNYGTVSKTNTTTTTTPTTTTYNTTYTYIQNEPYFDNTIVSYKPINIYLKTDSLPPYCSGNINIITIGAGGGGGGANYSEDYSADNVPQNCNGLGGYGGAIFNSIDSNNDLLTISNFNTINLQIDIYVGQGGYGSVISYDNKDYYNPEGEVIGQDGGDGGFTSVYITNNSFNTGNDPFYQQTSPGGSGGPGNFQGSFKSQTQAYPSYLSKNGTTITLTKATNYSCPTQLGGVVLYTEEENGEYTIKQTPGSISNVTGPYNTSGGGSGVNSYFVKNSGYCNGSNGTNTVPGQSPGKSSETNPKVGIGCGGGGGGLSSDQIEKEPIYENGFYGGNGYAEININCEYTVVNENGEDITFDQVSTREPGEYIGSVPTSTSTEPTWPSIDDLFTILNTNPSTFSSNFTPTTTTTSYTGIYTLTQTGPGLNNNSSNPIVIGFNSDLLPPSVTASLNVIVIGGGGGGGYCSQLANVFYSSQISTFPSGGGCSGTMISSSEVTLPSFTNESGIVYIGALIGNGGAGGTVNNNNNTLITGTADGSVYSNNDGFSGENSYVVIQTEKKYNFIAPGGSGGIGEITQAPVGTPPQTGIGGFNQQFPPITNPSYCINNGTSTSITTATNYSCLSQQGGYIWIYASNNPVGTETYTIGSSVTDATISKCKTINVSGGGGGGSAPSGDSYDITYKYPIIFRPGTMGNNGTNTRAGATPTDPASVWTYQKSPPSYEENPNFSYNTVGVGCGGGGCGFINSSTALSNGTGNAAGNGFDGGPGYLEIIVTCTYEITSDT